MTTETVFRKVKPMSFETQDVERKVLAILKILRYLQEPAGARRICQHLNEYGVTLGERAVRYHLHLMDERGLTELMGKHDGRIITNKGLSEIKNALVKDKVGFAIAKIEMLSFRTDFDYEAKRGNIPVNISIFQKDDFSKALRAMKSSFNSGYCVSQLIATAKGGERLGEIAIPPDKIGLATVCSIVINGSLLKAGVPIDSRFGGILQVSNHKPTRFTEIISYSGCSLDPSEIFIRAKMTSVREAASTGTGEILANFREVPAICTPILERVLDGLKAAGVGGVMVKGNPSDNICEIAVDPNKVGVILVGGLNPVAAAQEAGIMADNYSMSTVVEYRDLIKFSEL